MGVGPKIKEFRIKVGLTQKNLADMLHVTYQAVSRWENDDSEPSIDTLKEMCGIFNCSMEELLEMERKEEKEETSVEGYDNIQEIKPVLAVCEQCNKPIYEPSEINRFNESFQVKTGRTHHTEIRQRILCGDCNNVRLLEEQRKEEQRTEETKAKFKKQRIHSFIWPTLVALIFIISGIGYFVDGDASTGFDLLITGVLAYCFVAAMILNNTFITDMWLEITSWGFVKLPGIIFEFSIDGFIFLILMKILFFILGIMLALLAASFATIIAMILSVFVYPFALKKNLKCEEKKG